MLRLRAVLTLLLLLPLAACGGHAGSTTGILPPAAAPSSRNLASTTVSGSVPMHVQTATYLWSSTEAATSPSTYAPYLTWAYPLFSKMATTKAAGINVIFYVNPMMPQKGDSEYTALSTTYAPVEAKTCTGNTVTTYNGNGLLADPRTPQAATYITAQINWYIQNKVLASNAGATHPWDAVFVDNDGGLYGVSAMPCNYDPVQWGTAMDAAVSAAGQPIVVNSFSNSAANAVTFANYVNGTNVIGGLYEECFQNNTWLAEEESQITVVSDLKAAGKAPGPGWWCYVDNTSADAATVIPQRLFDYASFLLTYDPNYSMFQESFTTPSTFAVYPETGFVPLQPTTTPTDVSQLEISGGAYVRNYGACYYRGTALGPCEVAVNPGTSTVPLPNSFANSMVISGEGVLDGGSVAFNGGPVTSLAPKTGAILINPIATPSPSPSPTVAPTPTPTAAPASSNLIGTVDYMKYFSTTGEFQLQNGSTYTWICTNSSTTWSGPALAVGQSVTIAPSTKSSSCVTAASVTAATLATLSTVSTPAPAPTPTPTPTPTPVSMATTVSGAVIYATFYSTTGGFQVKTSSGTTMWVYGPKPYTSPVSPGKSVTATGTMKSGSLYATTVTVQ